LKVEMMSSLMLWLFLCGVVYFNIVMVEGHSWMSCPRPFNQNPLRGGTLSPPCEQVYKPARTPVKAGDRLKVGWTSNNHGGGYVRLALIRAKNDNRFNFYGATEDEFKNNVLKFACYGHDETIGVKFGDCVHPCNARPGCEFQRDVTDVERFDTTITVPTNLSPGLYILQAAQLVGNARTPYFSCSLLDVSGGNPGLDCKSSDQPTTYNCIKSPAGAEISVLTTGTKRGDFCFLASGRGEIDDRILEVPVNVDCDPREHCGLSVNNAKCKENIGMEFLDQVRGDPKQLNCKKPLPAATCDDQLQNQGETGVDCGGPCPPCPSCDDKKQNQGEEGVDCGGPCSRSCSTCSDGVKNFGETGVDCGGACGPCATCTDGKRNQGEYGIDCGGPCCQVCKPTCEDGIQNQGEEAVDCGGANCKKCQPEEKTDHVEVEHVQHDDGSKYLHVVMLITFLKNVEGGWTLRFEYDHRVNVTSTCGYATLLKKSRSAGGDIFTFASNPWSPPPKQGEKHKLYMVVVKSNRTQVVKPTGVFFEVQPVDHTPQQEVNKKDVPCGSKTCRHGEVCTRVEKLPCKKFPCETETCASKMII